MKPEIEYYIVYYYKDNNDRLFLTNIDDDGVGFSDKIFFAGEIETMDEAEAIVAWLKKSLHGDVEDYQISKILRDE